MSVAVVTGASSGIGRSTAEEFARRGYSVVLLARRADLLNKIADGFSKEYPRAKFLSLRCDVSDWAEVSEVAKKLEKILGKVNILVNNAGAFEYAPFEKSTHEKLDEMIDVNLKGVIYMTKFLLPLLKLAVAHGEWAKIVNVSSIAGLWAFSNMTVYTATKFAVTGFTAGLRRELRKYPIGVASIHPGPVQSKLQSGHESLRSKKPLVMLPDQVARQIFRLATSRRNRLISHPAFMFLNAVESCSPGVVDTILKKCL